MYAHKGDVDALKDTALDLMTVQWHQQELKAIIEPQLVQLNHRWEELLHRICVSTVLFYMNKLFIYVGANICT